MLAEHRQLRKPRNESRGNDVRAGMVRAPSEGGYKSEGGTRGRALGLGRRTWSWGQSQGGRNWEKRVQRGLLVVSVSGLLGRVRSGGQSPCLGTRGASRADPRRCMASALAFAHVGRNRGRAMLAACSCATLRLRS